MSDQSTDHPLLLLLRQYLTSCSNAVVEGDFSKAESTIAEIVSFLDSIMEAVALNPDDEDANGNAFQVLAEIRSYICSPSLDQEVIGMLSFELPKAASKFAGVSSRCLDIVDGIIERFIATCGPRDMLLVLCEALDSSSNASQSSAYFSPLLSGLSKVFLSIQRRHFEQLKVAIPVILRVLRKIPSESDDDMDCDDLFNRAISIADSVHAVCTKVDGAVSKKLCSLLGLYVLEVMDLVSIGTRGDISRCIPLVIRLTCFFQYCGLSYIGLITGSDIDSITSVVIGDEDDCMTSLSYVRQGASLSVIWGCASDEVAHAAKEDLTTVKDELRSDQIKRWQAVGMLKHIFSSVNLSWKLKKHAVDFLLCITEGDDAGKCDEEQLDCSSYIPSLFAALQAIIMVIMYSPDAMLRKNAFRALKKVLADIPTYQRCDILKALISNNDSSSMVAILLDIFKEEMRVESRKRLSHRKDEVQGDKKGQKNFFWSPTVIELVELVLRPPKGGPPSLPEYTDAVLSALNLYRFALIAESTGQTKYTGVLSKNNLQKAYNEWLLPLRTLVTGILTENKSEYDQLSEDIGCALNPVELVLYRCIELVEEKMKNSL